MTRYFVSEYTDGPATRWNVIDRNTQERVMRFPTSQEAWQYAAILENRNEFHGRVNAEKREL